MAGILDDLDTRTGSATSLLRTVIGAVLRDHGGWMSSAALIELMRTAGVPVERTRTALSRVKAKGLLCSQSVAGVPGYVISPDAIAMLERGDRRIFNPRVMSARDGWCLISFTVPEAQRELRRRLRQRLGWIGCGTVAPALWICPAHLTREAQAIVSELGLGPQVSLFLSDEPLTPRPLAEMVGDWWDLGALGSLHETFLERHAQALESYRASPQPATAFRLWITALDSWRPIPYLDPGLSPDLLPSDWPGRRSIPLFLELRDTLTAPAGAFVRGVVADAAGSPPGA